MKIGVKALKILFLFPLFFLIVISVFPVLYSIYLSFFRGNFEEFIGISNYVFLAQDPSFIQAMKVTLTFVALTVVIELALGLLLGFILFQPEVGKKSFWQTIFLLPLAVSPVVAGVMFKILYHPSLGPFGYLSLLGINPPPWLEEPTLALISVSIINAWMWTPFAFLILYTGMRAIPFEIIESAQLDGASSFKLLTKIILPLIKSLILVVVLFRAIDNLLVFDEIMGSTAGGPAFATTTFAIYVYKLAFKSWDLGYAAAASTILFIITIVITISLIRIIYQR